MEKMNVVNLQKPIKKKKKQKQKKNASEPYQHINETHIKLLSLHINSYKLTRR